MLPGQVLDELSLFAKRRAKSYIFRYKSIDDQQLLARSWKGAVYGTSGPFLEAPGNYRAR